MVGRTRVKICGITRPEDGLRAAGAGADAIGLVFYPRSPRAVSVEQARAVTAALPPFVTVVGLFVNAAPAEVAAVVDQVPVDLLQFHGDEAPEDCAGFGRPYIKALRMREDLDLQAEADRYREAAGLLLDTYRPGVPGGTGHSFDWTRLPGDLGTPLILAGGLGPHNVYQAIRQAGPFAVDVSSGVEAAKGVKDAGKLTAFMGEVYRADAERF